MIFKNLLNPSHDIICNIDDTFFLFQGLLGGINISINDNMLTVYTTNNNGYNVDSRLGFDLDSNPY